MRVALTGIGLLIKSCADLAGLQLRHDCMAPPDAGPIENIPRPECMTARDQRRMSRLTRLALYAADAAWGKADLRGKNGAVLFGQTHGSTASILSLHDNLLDGGPDLISPNAFSNGTANSPTSAIASYLKLSRAGITLAGGKNCGLDILTLASRGLAGEHWECCCAGCAEEYSPEAETVYLRRGKFLGKRAPWLPYPEGACEPRIAEAGVFFALEPLNREVHQKALILELFSDVCKENCQADCILSNAGGGFSDTYEFAALATVLPLQKVPPAVLFPKYLFGETFSVSVPLAVALAAQLLNRGHVCKTDLVHPDFQQLIAQRQASSPPRSILIISADYGDSGRMIRLSLPETATR